MARRNETMKAPIAPAPRDQRLPLSFAQQRLWFEAQIDPGSFSYNVPLFLRLAGRLDRGALEHALRSLVERHEVLRTHFPLASGEPVQRIEAVDRCASTRRERARG